jgi:hypothetical protein
MIRTSSREKRLQHPGWASYFHRIIPEERRQTRLHKLTPTPRGIANSDSRSRFTMEQIERKQGVLGIINQETGTAVVLFLKTLPPVREGHPWR